jgi:hypothetical protein
MGWHGKACRVTITSDDGAKDEMLTVETERDTKTPSQRLRSVLFVLYKEQERTCTFDSFYSEHMEKFILHVKAKLSS